MVYVDTNILIYLFEGNKQYSMSIAEYLEDSRAKDIKLVTSALTVTELIAGNSSITLDMVEMLNNLEVVALDGDIAELAGRLQNAENILIGDSVHLATALNRKCTTIYTNDDKLAKKSSKFMKILKP